MIKNLDISKATGYDKLPAKLLRLSAESISWHMTSIFNQCIDDRSFPDAAKLAEVVPSFKKDDNLSVKNYRPISILSVLSKVLERLMVNQLTPFLDRVLHPRIAAYRNGYSCQTVLLRLVEDWKQAAERKEQVGGVMMDLSKAFDCLPHELITAKLHAYGADIPTCALIWSYLENRKQRVRISGQTGEWKTLKKGVPQGSIMGPVLFNLFVNDIVYIFERSTLYNYADDNTISVSGPSKEIIIQTLANETQKAIEWFRVNMMEANPQKFQALFLKHRVSQSECTIVNVNDFIIKSETNVKLLGVKIDEHLNFNEHIKDTCRKAGAQLNVLNRLSRNLDVHGRMSIFRCFILSHFNYCALVWHFCGVKNSNKLERIQYRALKFVFMDFNSPYESLLKRAKLNSLETSRKQMMLKEMYKAVNGMSPEILRDLFKVKVPRYNLRSKITVQVNHCRTVKHGLNKLSTYGAKLWNSLPDKIKHVDYQTFCKHADEWTEPDCKCRMCFK